MKIELINISKKYGKTYVLKDFCAQFENGIYGVLGRNGAGKTTLINIMLGITMATEGEILVDGETASRQNLIEKVGYLPQYPVFYKEMKVKDFLEYIAVLKGVKDGKEKIESLLRETNLYEERDKYIGKLSGGMRQRVGIAQALLNDPKVLVLDEPTAGLDPQERIRFRNLISKFSKDRIVLIVTHIVSDVEFIANKILIMDRGEIKLFGDLENIIYSVEGKIWEISRLEIDDFCEIDFSKVSNIKREWNHTVIRMVSDRTPSDDAISVQPKLEDVFLYCCEK